jgi:hypothetical protein
MELKERVDSVENGGADEDEEIIVDYDRNYQSLAGTRCDQNLTKD